MPADANILCAASAAVAWTDIMPLPLALGEVTSGLVNKGGTIIFGHLPAPIYRRQ